MTRVRKAVRGLASVVAGAVYLSSVLADRIQGDSESAPYTRFIENTTDGYLLLDDEDRIVETNKAARRILTVDGTLSGRDVTTVLPDVAPLVSDSSQTRVELTVTTDDCRQYIAARYVPLPETEAEAEQLIALRDTTQRRRVEKRYQELIENATDLVVVTDETGTITFAGPSFERILGHDPEQLVDSDLVTEIHAGDRDTVQAALDQLLANPNTTQRFEYRVQTRSGEWRVLEGIGRNLLDNPDVQGIVINSRDITERKKRERDLERQNQRLEEFAHVVSHDLRNPLQIAKGYMEQAERTGDEGAFRHVEQAHQRIETIIEDVLTLARQGKSVGETSSTDLAPIARDAWQTVETDEATLVIDGDRQIEADTGRLRQLFENLFRNCVEHAGPSVTVTLGLIEPMHTSTRIDSRQRRGFFVADDGPGIPEDNREKVFTSGFTTDDDGTGFGLAIVEQIAEAHHWEVSVTSSRDGGARFEFVELSEDQQLTPDDL